MAVSARRLVHLMVVGLVAAMMPALPGAAAVDSGVRLSVSDGQPFVGQRTTLTAAVQPAVRGRAVRFQVLTRDGWVTQGTDRTDGSGAAAVRLRFGSAGRTKVRALALPHRAAEKATDSLTLKVRKRPTEMAAELPDGPWQLDEPVLVQGSVKPVAAGRSVRLERSSGAGWQPVGEPAVTDSRGEVWLPWTPTEAGTHDYRLAVAPTRKFASAVSAPGTRTVEGEEGPLVVQAPEWVLTGELFEVVLEITAPDAALTDVTLAVHAPKAGEQVSPPAEVDVDPATREAVVDVGDVLAGNTEHRRLRWKAPSATESLTFEVSLSASTQSGGGMVDQQTVAEVLVLQEPSGGGAFGGGLELTREGRFAPDHPDQVFAFCDRVFEPAQVPAFPEAKAAAEAYLAGVILDEETWNEEAALDDPTLIDQVVMMALADQRPAAALAAALRGHELAANDAVHLTNAAVAANVLKRPEWAVAFTRRAALAGPAPSVGAPQEAIRLATQAHAWALLGRRSDAVVTMRDALMVDPDNPQLHAQLGILLACEGDKEGALPHVRRGLRSDESTDPMEHPDDYPENMRMTWLGASDLYDLSGGTEDTITTPTLPAGWAQLIGRGRLEGSGYYEQERTRLHDRFMQLAQRRNDLQQQLNARLTDASPAWRQRTQDILRRISSSGDRAVRESWENYLDYSREVLHLNGCPDGVYQNHPYCFPGDPDADRSCSLDATVFQAWLNRIRGWETAMNDYHDVAWPVFTGLQANLVDPVAHELAGVLIEMHFLSHGVMAIAANLTTTADQFTFYNTDQDEPENCLNPAGPGETEESTVQGPGPAFCSPDSVETKFSVSIDLGIMTFGFDCEKVSIETGLGAYGFLEAFARVEQNWNTSAVTYYVGAQAGIPFVGSYESALFLETDATGKVQDLGIESGVSSSAGYVVEVELYSDSARVSAMSYFTSF